MKVGGSSGSVSALVTALVIAGGAVAPTDTDENLRALVTTFGPVCSGRPLPAALNPFAA